MGYVRSFDPRQAHGDYKPQGIHGTWVAGSGQIQTLGSITDKAGIVFNIMVMTEPASSNSHLFAPRVGIDGWWISPSAGWTFDDLNTAGFDKTTTPISIINYVVDGVNIVNYSIPHGLKFNTLALQVTDYTPNCPNNVTFKSYWLVETYQKV